jgi:hypothetical protein
LEIKCLQMMERMTEQMLGRVPGTCTVTVQLTHLGTWFFWSLLWIWAPDMLFLLPLIARKLENGHLNP